MSKYKTYILITCLCTAIIIAGSYFSAVHIKQRLNDNLVRNYSKQELEIAGNLAKTLESEIQTTKNQLMLMGQDPDIRDGQSKACTAAIRADLAQIDSKLGNVGRVDKDGIFRCSLNPSLIGTEASKLGPYITDIFSDPDHAPVMSRVIKVPGAAGSGYLTALHVPVWGKDGQFDGTLGGAIYLSDIQQKYLRDVVFAHRGFVVLIDDDGTVLYHQLQWLIGTNIHSDSFKGVIADPSPFDEILIDVKAGKSGIRHYQSTTQGEKIAGYVPVHVLPGRSWAVMVSVPTTDIAVDLEEFGVDVLLTRIWALTALLVLIAAGGFIYFSRKLSVLPPKNGI